MLVWEKWIKPNENFLKESGSRGNLLQLYQERILSFWDVVKKTKDHFIKTTVATRSWLMVQGPSQSQVDKHPRLSMSGFGW